MKTWRFAIEVDTEDTVTFDDVRGLAQKVADDAQMRAGDDIKGRTEITLCDVEDVS